MSIFKQIYQKARSNLKKIVLPEGDEPRVIAAAQEAQRKKLAQLILLGKSEVILKQAKENRLNISELEIIDPQKDEKLDDYITSYWELRKHRGISLDQAKDLLLQDFVYVAAMMLRENRVDGFVAGACHTTSDVVRAALHCIPMEPQRVTACSSFLIETPDEDYGERGVFLFADCGVVPLPSVNQLADIAESSAELWVRVTGYTPRLAMLSFSSYGSSKHPCVDRIREAAEIVKKKRPDLIIDGELQVDSAIVPAVAKIKVPQSPLAGRANILIFPSLDAGNIAYKLLQWLAKARVVGPIIQGLERPCADLSRGASPREIVDSIAVTAVRAQ